MSGEWSTVWPTKPGWYWTWIPSEGRPEPRPTEVRLAGSDPKKFWMYARDSGFMFPVEYQDRVVWWLPLETPEAPSS